MSRPRKAKRLRTGTGPGTEKSIWNTKDDWDTLVAESRLSTSSISRRPPPPAGLKSLTTYCAEVAGRSLKRFWELDTGLSWKYAWSEVPDRLKVGVRDEVYRHWGGYLTTAMISEVFCHPPYMHLPGQRLPTITSAERLIPYRAKPDDAERYTRLTLRHAEKATDTAIAGLIHSMPQLEEINLKGCSLAGQRTVEIICKRCKGIKKLNLKGTSVNEEQMRELLDTFGTQLEVFKIDRVVIESPEETFIQDSYPLIRKLCLPGDMLQPGAGDFRRRRLQSGDTIDWPPARPTAESARIRWENFGKLFPSLTHLSLPALWAPESARFSLAPDTLVKLDLGHGGPPVPFSVMHSLVDRHHATLRHVACGNEFTGSMNHTSATHWDDLGQSLAQCESLKVLDIRSAPRGSKSYASHSTGSLSSAGLLYIHALDDTRINLKRLTLGSMGRLGIGSPADWVPNEDQRAALQELRIPSAHVHDTQSLANTLATCYALRILDVSGISFTDDEIFTILDGCPNLHTIDLTSCRGIKVQNRRNIFKAWQESRAPSSSSPPPASTNKTKKTTTRSGRVSAKRKR